MPKSLRLLTSPRQTVWAAVVSRQVCPAPDSSSRLGIGGFKLQRLGKPEALCLFFIFGFCSVKTEPAHFIFSSSCRNNEDLGLFSKQQHPDLHKPWHPLLQWHKTPVLGFLWFFLLRGHPTSYNKPFSFIMIFFLNGLNIDGNWRANGVFYF